MSALAALFVTLSIIGGTALFSDEWTIEGDCAVNSVGCYACYDRQIVMPCDSISQYVLPNGKCNNAELDNKLCKTGDGWIEIVNNETIIDNDSTTNVTIDETVKECEVCEVCVKEPRTFKVSDGKHEWDCEENNCLIRIK